MRLLRHLSLALASVLAFPAIGAPTFSLDPASSSLFTHSLTPDDVLKPGPAVYEEGALLGLRDDLGAGLFDNLNALSYGDDPIDTPLYFSVDRVAIGLVGSAVYFEALPGVEEAAGDVYVSLPPYGDNGLYVDEEDWGLEDPATFGDDLDALDLDSGPHPYFYFSVDDLSESVLGTPAAGQPKMHPGDVWKSTGDGNRTLFASYLDLGLQATDDLDALVLLDANGSTTWDDGDVILFSLSTFSPSTWTGSGLDPTDYQFCVPGFLSPADVCQVTYSTSPGYTGFASAADLGLRDDDELNALDTVTVPEPFSPLLLIAGLLGLSLVRREGGRMS